MKILHVYGDEHAAMNVDDDFGVKKAYELAKENGGSYTIETDDLYAKLLIHEFGEVDPKFVGFIKQNMIDYDYSKNEDFFVIED